jgi:acetylornithine deacetylase/succinyl-diaminopimelate desuccinylase-like protein
MSDVERALEWAEEHFENSVADLCGFLRVPAISCDPEHHGDVRRLAERIRDELSELGFRAEVRQLPGALPLVAAERRSGRADAPTVLVYGHLDLQPVRGEAWDTPPHEPTRIGERLYARGAADDMGGWVSHVAALRAWLAVSGDLPVHVKLVIEGEEEIGSPNLEAYMDAFPEDFHADVMVLTDCENPSTDLPGLTTSLRGLYEVELTCEALTSDIHSGLWGNMAPDVGNALVLLLARLVDEQGRMRLGRRDVPESWREGAAAIPLTSEVITQGAHLLPGVQPLPLEGRPAAEWLWRQPAVTILSTTLPRPSEHKNAVRRKASACLSIRIPPGMTHDAMRALLEAELLRDPPGGVRVHLEDRPGRAESWLYEPQGPAFDAANRAYEKAWGRPLVQIGIGGSIPFVALFGRRYAHLPLILNGVMDPETGAHGPNESLHLGVFRKAIRANVVLFDELARLGDATSG